MMPSRNETAGNLGKAGRRFPTNEAGASVHSGHNDTSATRGRQVLYAGAKHTCSIDPDGWLRKTAKAEHMLRVPPAWAFDAAHIDAAKQADVIGVEVTVAETGRIYRIDFANFLRHAFTFNRGYGAQVGCELRHWNASGPELPKPQPVLTQLALW